MIDLSFATHVTIRGFCPTSESPMLVSSVSWKPIHESEMTYTEWSF